MPEHLIPKVALKI